MSSSNMEILIRLLVAVAAAAQKEVFFIYKHFFNTSVKL
jgi:hypothetical protein